MNVIELYEEAKINLLTAFKINGYLGEISINRDFWKRSSDSIYFGNTPEEVECYCNELCDNWSREIGTHIMFYVDNGCGDRYYEIFDKSKEIIVHHEGQMTWHRQKK